MDKNAVFAALAAEVEQNELAFPTSARVALKLKQSLDANDAAVEAQQQLIENQKAEIVRINARYDAELARLKKLWAGAAPGSLPPLGEQPLAAPVAPSTPKR